MFKHILVPVDLADTELAKPSIETAVSLARASGGVPEWNPLFASVAVTVKVSSPVASASGS